MLNGAKDWDWRLADTLVIRARSCLVKSVSGRTMGGVRALPDRKHILKAMLAEVLPWQKIVPERPGRGADDILIDTAMIECRGSAVAVRTDALRQRRAT